MEIVIDIPDEIYNFIIQRGHLPYGVNIAGSIIDGKVLPKGHGDLVDRNYFIDKYAGCGSVYCEDNSCNECNSRIVNKLDVDNAPAVIPADKSEVY